MADQELRPCPCCKAYVRKDRFRKHLKKAHNTEAWLADILQRLKEDDVRAVEQRKKEYRQRFSSKAAVPKPPVHRFSMRPSSKKQPENSSDPKPIPDIMMTCPFCGTRIRQDQFKRHAEMKHDNPARASGMNKDAKYKVDSDGFIQSSKRSGKSKGTVSAGNGQSINYSKGTPEDDRTDARKYEGYFAREERGYGSFPVHDDYGDEAGPD